MYFIFYIVCSIKFECIGGGVGGGLIMITKSRRAGEAPGEALRLFEYCNPATYDRLRAVFPHK